jgi:hypothetical protein
MYFSSQSLKIFLLISQLTILTYQPAFAKSANEQISDQSAHVLQGQVQKIEISLAQLRDVGIDLKHLLKNLSSLYDEVTIQPVRIITQPSLVGAGTIINIPIGTQPIGPVEPPKKERVDLCMNEIKPVIDLMKTNIDEFLSGKSELDMSDKLKQKLQSNLDNWVTGVQKLYSQLNTLNQLTVGPTYNNAQIAHVTASMQNSIKDLDKNRCQIFKIIRKDGKKK